MDTQKIGVAMKQLHEKIARAATGNKPRKAKRVGVRNVRMHTFYVNDKVELRSGTFTSPDRRPAVNGLGRKLKTAKITGFDPKVKGLAFLDHKLGGYHTWHVNDLEEA